MKAADIDSAMFLAAVRKAANLQGHQWASRWSVEAVLADQDYAASDSTLYPEGGFPWMPSKVVLAKAKKLIRRGVMHGCACGCRGDWFVL